MTRHYAAMALLGLGALSFGRFVSITGWPVDECQQVLRDLLEAKRIAVSGEYHGMYYLR